MGENESRVLTILLTDIRNFTDRTSRSSRSDVVGLIEKNKRLVLPSLQKRGGRLVKTIGDAFLVVFNSPTDAVLAGVEAQRELARYNQSLPDEDKIEIRIAINIGEVNLVDNDIYGEPVNITSRIEGVAQAGEVYFTEAVYLAMNKTEVPSSEVGYLQLKGVPEKIRVYKVRDERSIEEGEAPAEPVLLKEKGAKAWAAEPDKAAGSGVWRWVFLAFIALGAATEGYWLSHRPHASVAPAGSNNAPKKGMALDCEQDLARFCGDVVAGQGRHVACLAAHSSELSPACAQDPAIAKALAQTASQAELPPLPKVPWEPGKVDKARSKQVNDACADEKRSLCGQVHGGHGRIFNCLWSHWDRLGQSCQKASLPFWREVAGLKP